MNYIKLNGKKIELTDEQVSEIQRSLGLEQTQLKEIAVGDTFKVGKYEFIVLEHSGGTTAVLLKDLLYEGKVFGENNNYNGSKVDNLCVDFGNEIEAAVGAGNLVEHTVKLTADDGMKCYGSIKRKMSLLTANLYRRYVYVIDKYKLDKWWWLCTPFSTPAHEDSTWVKCVSPRGRISGGSCRIGDGGVRPFLRFVSSISVSCED